MGLEVADDQNRREVLSCVVFYNIRKKRQLLNLLIRIPISEATAIYHSPVTAVETQARKV